MYRANSTIYIIAPAIYIIVLVIYITAPAIYIIAPVIYITAPATYIIAPVIYIKIWGLRIVWFDNYDMDVLPLG